MLRNPVLVEALYDQAASNRATLRNLLQREGYESLAQVRDEGLFEGRALSLLQLLVKRHGELPRAVRERILACRDLGVLDDWFQRALDARTLADVMG